MLSKALLERLESYDASLKADDPRLNGKVEIQHSDGSLLKLNHSFVVQIENHLIAFTEHLGHLVFFFDDLEKVVYDHIEHWQTDSVPSA